MSIYDTVRWCNICKMYFVSASGRPKCLVCGAYSIWIDLVEGCILFVIGEKRYES